MGASAHAYGQKECLYFIVKNVSPQKKRINIFQYPINLGEQRDLLSIPGIAEADIKASLLKGEIKYKFLTGDIELVYSNIDLLQFNECQKNWLSNFGFDLGLEIGVPELAKDTINFITYSGGGGAGGITPGQHETLKQLIHFIDEGPATGFITGAFKEILDQPFPSSVTWYKDNTKQQKIVEKLIIRNGDQNPISIIWNMYDDDGITIIHTITDTITYIMDSFEYTRTRAIT